jgi:hypothetical protein
MEREDETQEQGGGEQTEEGAPSAPGDGEQTDDTSSDNE